ncbi:MAG: phage Gp37/Gp68 family protein [Acidobacteria bacterium]|nr:phage Gp37/Gp68 family protein [Acidobacteriota bacterium]
MAESTKIEWADHTFNPWRGCTKVSPACEHCYAETMSHRNPKTLGVWGKHGTRVIASEAMWREPLKWNKRAGEGAFVAPYRPRVFCASLADVFEGQDTLPDGTRNAIREARKRLFALIHATPNLNWLLLTKRPELVTTILESDVGLYGPLRADFPNIWMGTTVESQKYADIRVPHLLEIEAAVLWLSIEPLLSQIDISEYMWPVCHEWDAGFPTPERAAAAGCEVRHVRQAFVHADSVFVDWVVVGGESGPNARPMHPDWVRSIRDACAAASVPFFFKQWGEWGDAGHLTEVNDRGSGRLHNWGDGEMAFPVGKKAAGRLLDGREWNEMPEVKNATTK